MLDADFNRSLLRNQIKLFTEKIKLMPKSEEDNDKKDPGPEAESLDLMIQH